MSLDILFLPSGKTETSTFCGPGPGQAVADIATTLERAEEISQQAIENLGHWRNRWEVPEKHAHLARRQGALSLGDGTWLGYSQFTTSEAAEGVARRFADYNLSVFGIRYIGPEFFPHY